MQLLDVIQRSAAYLAERGVESPRLQVEWILAHTLRVPRLQLYLQFERHLATPELDAVRSAVQRRGRREPLQHVLGTTSFCGLDFETSPAALIPRPETELLAETALHWLSSRPLASPPPRVLDWGTGTGCLALTLATRLAAAEVWALELSPDAAQLARRNQSRHPAAHRVHIVVGDGCPALPPDLTFDLVVSNPPYIPTGDLPTLEPEVRDHDPRLALDGGPDGLDVFRRLARELPPRLRPNAVFLAEFGDGQTSGLKSLFTDAGWIVDGITRDYTGRDRYLLARRPA